MVDYQALLNQVKIEFPNFEIRFKDQSWLMKFINYFLIALSFGKNKAFMTDYITTINNAMYVPTTWDTMTEKQRCIIVRHERVHMRQASRLGFLKFAFLYIFAAFPVVWATYRTEFEKEAYEESLRAMCEYYGVKIAASAGYKDFIVSQFTSSAYGWMCIDKAKIEAWHDAALQKALSENIFKKTIR